MNSIGDGRLVRATVLCSDADRFGRAFEVTARVPSEGPVVVLTAWATAPAERLSSPSGGQGASALEGRELSLDPKYRGCPYCGRRSLVSCAACGHALSCWDDAKGPGHRAPCCGWQGEPEPGARFAEPALPPLLAGERRPSLQPPDRPRLLPKPGERR